jgi:hypothetical protein
VRLLPKARKARNEREPPHRASPQTLKELPLRRKLRKERVDAAELKPFTDRIPARTKDLLLKLLPQSTKSRTLAAPPTCMLPYTDRELPSRAKLRTDRAEPDAAKSSMENVLDRRQTPYKLQLLPNLA